MGLSAPVKRAGGRRNQSDKRPDRNTIGPWLDGHEALPRRLHPRSGSGQRQKRNPSGGARGRAPLVTAWGLRPPAVDRRVCGIHEDRSNPAVLDRLA